ncbi:hypothetical protein MY3296_009320 [Beauveria thailandica]
MNEATVHNNLGSQQVRFVHDRIDKQQRSEARISTYRFPELEFFQEDFELQSWWACAHALHGWTVLMVLFLRRGEPVFTQGAVTEEVDAIHGCDMELTCLFTKRTKNLPEEVIIQGLIIPSRTRQVI